jgi:RNA polymerase sigma-70 factor (ECF subfamily)
LDKNWDEDNLIGELEKDPLKFELLFEHYFDRIFSFFFSRTYDRPTAEDLTSRTFIKILQALPQYQPKGSLAAWVFTIARNTLNSYFRSADYRFNETLDDQELLGLSTENNSRQPFIDLDNRIDLARIIKGLKYKDRELLSLRYAAELSYEEIAIILRKRPGAVKMSVHRLLRKVKERMEREK